MQLSAKLQSDVEEILSKERGGSSIQLSADLQFETKEIIYKLTGLTISMETSLMLGNSVNI